MDCNHIELPTMESQNSKSQQVRFEETISSEQKTEIITYLDKGLDTVLIFREVDSTNVLIRKSVLELRAILITKVLEKLRPSDLTNPKLEELLAQLAFSSIESHTDFINDLNIHQVIIRELTSTLIPKLIMDLRTAK